MVAAFTDSNNGDEEERKSIKIQKKKKDQKIHTCLKNSSSFSVMVVSACHGCRSGKGGALVAAVSAVILHLLYRFHCFFLPSRREINAAAARGCCILVHSVSPFVSLDLSLSQFLESHNRVRVSDFAYPLFASRMRTTKNVPDHYVI